MSVNQRIIKETQKLKKDPISGISAEPFSDNPRYFNVVISGPKDSPYEGGKFHLQLYLPEEYPMVPPKCIFMLLSIQSLLNEPNTADPLNEKVNDHWLKDKKDAEKTAKEWTKKYASK